MDASLLAKGAVKWIRRESSFSPPAKRRYHGVKRSQACSRQAPCSGSGGSRTLMAGLQDQNLPVGSRTQNCRSAQQPRRLQMLRKESSFSPPAKRRYFLRSAQRNRCGAAATPTARSGARTSSLVKRGAECRWEGIEPSDQCVISDNHHKSARGAGKLVATDIPLRVIALPLSYICRTYWSQRKELNPHRSGYEPLVRPPDAAWQVAEGSNPARSDLETKLVPRPRPKISRVLAR